MKNETDNIVKALRDSIEKDKDSKMEAIVARIPLLCQSVLNIHDKLEELKIGQEKIREKLETHFVTNDRFWPIKTIVYSGVGVILLGVATAILTTVVQ